MDSSHWRYFKQLHFLLEHIKPRGCGSLDDQQLDLEVDLSLDNDETNRSYSSDPHCKSEANGEDPLSEASSSTQLQPSQAQEEFVRVMGLLETVLAQKLNEQPPTDVPQADPFYKYLESILSRVEASARADIQLEILNFANQLVKNAKTQSAS
ncbi:uncharacterized protein LOC135430842 [Drosophila montana]|uniref:uncharacterized protein LOC135430842 n=1 Tax=Drosophila montana TaxID=40370 RepID=UPI00313B61E0